MLDVVDEPVPPAAVVDVVDVVDEPVPPAVVVDVVDVVDEPVPPAVVVDVVDGTSPVTRRAPTVVVGAAAWGAGTAGT